MSRLTALRIMKIAAVLILAAAAVYAVFQATREQSVPVRIGGMAPDFALADRLGSEHQLSQYKGKTVLLNFWATWCNPCVNELPLLNEAYKLLKEDGAAIEFVAVNIGEDNEAIQKFVDRYDLVLPIWLDEQNKVKKLYRISSMPLTLMISPSGDIVDIHEGEITDIADIMMMAARAGSN